jgi:hypothetical protein
MRELIEAAPSLVAVILLTGISWVLFFHRNYVIELFRSVRARFLKESSR